MMKLTMMKMVSGVRRCLPSLTTAQVRYRLGERMKVASDLGLGSGSSQEDQFHRSFANGLSRFGRGGDEKKCYSIIIIIIINSSSNHCRHHRHRHDGHNDDDDDMKMVIIIINIMISRSSSSCQYHYHININIIIITTTIIIILLIIIIISVGHLVSQVRKV